MPPEVKPKKIYSVSDLSSNIKALLEENYPIIWIYGEISNLKIAGSGHCYFILKDKKAQIQAVMFRGQQSRLKFQLEDGLEITGMGRITLYEPRGAYQLILEYAEPMGIGALQKAFEQLKARLSSEGLFGMEHKKKIPFLPRKIALITSPTGAVVHDMIHILRRRFENVEILILPCRVQGKEAVNELVEAFQAVDSLEDVDVTILARGGGSLEDLIAFNSEELARAIFASKVPVISAVGHETDYTIADFVADLRAPTPSAAAELAAPVKMELKKSCDAALNGISIRMLRCISDCRSRLNHRRERMVHPRKRIEDHLLRLDDVASRMERTLSGILSVRREHLGWKVEKLSASSTDKLVEKLKVKLENLNYKYNSLMKIYLKNKRFKVQEKTSKLAALDPAAVLARGYSITRLLPGKTILHEAECVPVDAHVEITLNKGMLFCRVEGKKSNEQKNDV